MSFVRTLATLAMGVAATKGYQKYKDLGGVQGVQDALKNNPQTAEIGRRAEEALARVGIGSGSGGMAGGLAGPGGGAGGIGGLLGSLGASAAGMLTGLLDQVTGTTVATDTAESSARLMIRAMVMAAKADGHIDAEERAAIMNHLVDSSPEERAYVEAQMEAPVDPLSLAKDVSGAAKSQVYAAAAMIIRADTPSEQQFLATLAQGLGLEAATVSSIHASLGKAAPSA